VRSGLAVFAPAGATRTIIAIAMATPRAALISLP
jgi:hypothetical protein